MILAYIVVLSHHFFNFPIQVEGAMKKLLLLIIICVFFSFGTAISTPLFFSEVPENPLAINVSSNPTSEPIHWIGLSVQSFGSASELDVFTNAEGFSMAGNLDIESEEDASGLLSGVFTHAMVGFTLFLTDPVVRTSNSFDLEFDVNQPDIGISSYTLHWDTGDQPLEFNNVRAWLNQESITQPSNQLFVKFDLILTEPDILDSLPLFTTTISGDFAPVPEPATMILIGTGLIGLAGLRRRFKK